MSRPKTDRSQTYTYEDYLTWDGPERWELIDGVPYLLASPTPEHQRIALRLGTEFELFLRSRNDCVPYIAPMDLTMEESRQTKRVVQPDLFVMCGAYGRDQRIVGVPVLVIEILSPTTAAHDLIRKFNLYQRVGVQEYWVVEPEPGIVNVYLHDGTTLRFTAEYKVGDALSPSMFPDLTIDVRTIFA